MRVKFTFLGTGSAIQSTGIGASLLVEDAILVDAPAGVPQALNRAGCDLQRLETVLITHLHGDHVFGLPFLLMEHLARPRETPLQIVGPDGSEILVGKLLELAFPGDTADDVFSKAMPVFNSSFHGKQIHARDLTMTLQTAPHGEMETYGIVFTLPNQRTVFYAPDVLFQESLVEIIKRSDVAILDSTTADEPVGAHMSLRQLNHLAERFPEKVFLSTHRSAYDIRSFPFRICENLLIPHEGDCYYF